MKRPELGEAVGQEVELIGTVEGFGEDSVTHTGEVRAIVNVKIAAGVSAVGAKYPHMWITNPGEKLLSLMTGTRVRFKGRVYRYGRDEFAVMDTTILRVLY